MGEFKLIAIRPLTGCSRRFLKNLKAGEVYNFYNDYKFRIDDRGNVNGIAYRATAPSGFYNIRKRNGEELSVNVSAIVGKNGSGKSTISELFLLALFRISLQVGLVDKSTFLHLDSQEVEDQNEAKRYESDVAEMSQGLRVELFYLVDGKIIRIKVADKLIYDEGIRSGREFTFNDTANVISSLEELGHFFYTILINYSFYAFNSNIIGMWVKAFFHKNDGYQMPIVINPFREKGNLNVNTENILTSSRLLANILSISGYNKINTKSSIDYIELYFNSDKDYTTLDDGTERFSEEFIRKFRQLIISPLFKKMFNDEYRYPEIDTELKHHTEIYLINKLITIPSRYKSFKDYDKRISKKKERPDNYRLTEQNAARYVEELYGEGSHITLKVRQSLNFLREDIYGIPSQGDFRKSLKFGSAIRQLNKLKTKPWFTELIDYLPPPFLFSKIKFQDGSYFDSLSSGEKQKIHSENSIIYHLKNLESVHKSLAKNKITGRITYDTVNLIFDEVELYYHPEFQQSTLDDMLSLIKKSNLRYIKCINIIYLTHSPFILSDIPKQNTVLLDIDKSGRPKQLTIKKQSFGANIHELLSDNFFLKDTVMGTYASKKVSQIIRNIKKRRSSKSDLQGINLIGDDFLKSSIEVYKKTYDQDRN